VQYYPYNHLSGLIDERVYDEEINTLLGDNGIHFIEYTWVGGE
jgi:hypothetical protein